MAMTPAAKQAREALSRMLDYARYNEAWQYDHPEYLDGARAALRALDAEGASEDVTSRLNAAHDEVMAQVRAEGASTEGELTRDDIALLGLRRAWEKHRSGVEAFNNVACREAIAEAYVILEAALKPAPVPQGGGTVCEACASIRSDPQGLRLNIPAHTCKPAAAPEGHK